MQMRRWRVEEKVALNIHCLALLPPPLSLPNVQLGCTMPAQFISKLCQELFALWYKVYLQARSHSVTTITFKHNYKTNANKTNSRDQHNLHNSKLNIWMLHQCSNGPRKESVQCYLFDLKTSLTFRVSDYLGDKSSHKWFSSPSASSPQTATNVAAAAVSIHRGWLDTPNTPTLNSPGNTLLEMYKFYLLLDLAGNLQSFTPPWVCLQDISSVTKTRM